MANRKRRSARSGRPPLLSPGRPPVAGRNERRRFWAAIAAGMASEDAAVTASVPQAIGTRWFRKAGGMPPAMFRRSAKPLSGRYLSLAEREELAILRVQGAGVREIARQMGRSASTISRELRRNAATRSGGLDYRATTAQWHADRAARRPKPAKLAINAALRAYVQDRLAGVVVTPRGAAVPGPAVSWKGRRHGRRQDRRWASAWSPEQIAHRLRLDFPHDETMRISHEAIYQSLYVQGRGALRRELTACLRTGRALRVPRARTRGRGKSFIVPEIMIPLVGDVAELKNQKAIVIKKADETIKKYGVKLEYMIGTMIELPRAAVTADKIAEEAEFFSFGTNDLTQTTFGFSRDDTGKIIKYYQDHGVMEKDPFQVLDRGGVGQLVRMGVEKGRSVKPKLKVGICGEHGGDPNSVEFCHLVGLNYVSCSPFRVPIARLAAAQAALKNSKKGAKEYSSK